MERFIVGLERLIESTEQVVAASWRAARQVQAERAIETEGWRRQQLAHAARVAEMEREGEACIRHLEGEMDRLLAKVEERTTPMRLSRASSAVKIVRDSSVADETECGQSESARVQRRLDLSDESLATAIHGLAGATHRTVGTDRAKLPCLEESPSESLATLPHACNESSPSYPRTPDSEVPVPSRHRQAARTCVAELDVESLQETIQKKALADFAIEKKALEDALALAIRQRDAAVEQSEAAFKALKEVRRGQILSVKNFNAKGKEDAARRKRKEGNSESDESVRQQIVALKNKVLRRDLQIEKLKQVSCRQRDSKPWQSSCLKNPLYQRAGPKAYGFGRF